MQGCAHFRRLLWEIDVHANIADDREMQIEFHKFGDTALDKVLQKVNNDAEILHVESSIIIEGERRKV